MSQMGTEASKAWIASAGSLVTSLCVACTGIPDEICISLGTVVTGLLAYLIPNR